MSHQDFVGKDVKRKRYWARSLIGWEDMSKAQPNRAHEALALLENKAGIVKHIITQNVDGLHQRAGSQNVIDLHGSIDRVRCLVCNNILKRKEVQDKMLSENVEFISKNKLHGYNFDKQTEQRPDGDVQLSESIDFNEFKLPHCKHCASSTLHDHHHHSQHPASSDQNIGLLKPDVVFFGDNVPKPVVSSAFDAIEEADSLLVVGSSLEVFSAFRLVTLADKKGIPVCILNMGETRAERSKSIKSSQLLKVHLPCDEALWETAIRLGLTQ
jgi:NAD-dependent SIR2 family protein deacetylase